MKTVLVTLLVSMNLSLLLPCNGNDPVRGEGKESHPPLHVGLRTTIQPRGNCWLEIIGPGGLR
jgi:hypothetical protein